MSGRPRHLDRIRAKPGCHGLRYRSYEYVLRTTFGAANAWTRPLDHYQEEAVAAWERAGVLMFGYSQSGKSKPRRQLFDLVLSLPCEPAWCYTEGDGWWPSKLSSHHALILGDVAFLAIPIHVECLL